MGIGDEVYDKRLLKMGIKSSGKIKTEIFKKNSVYFVVDFKGIEKIYLENELIKKEI